MKIASRSVAPVALTKVAERPVKKVEIKEVTI